MKLINRKAAYEDLKFYQQICEIRKLIYKISERFVRSHPRLASQMRDAARSAKQNIREGYRNGSIGIFSNSLKISQGSLEELMGDIEDCLEDGLIQKSEFIQLSKLFKSADYMLSRYIQSLYKIKETGTWRKAGVKAVNVTSRNLSVTSRNLP